MIGHITSRGYPINKTFEIWCYELYIPSMHQVYHATSADVKNSAHTVVKAFIRDPFNAYFYNLISDQDNPPRGTEEMMALNIHNNLLRDSVLVVDEGGRKCAGVALWTPPRFKPLAWIDWGT